VLRSVLAAAALAASVLAVAVAAGQDEAAALAPAGRIVFCSDRSGTWRIWSCAPDGSTLQQLTTGTEDDGDFDPMAGPDGHVFLFTSTRGGPTGVWRMRDDSAVPERICDGDQAEWSPDGKRICFRRQEAIWTRHLELGTEKRLTDEAWPHCSGPAWSPDGKTIAFACRWEAGNGVFLIPAGGGEPVSVYNEEGACEPHWSPDASLLVYETETHLCTIKPDGTGNRLVTWFGGVQRYGRFGPDGRRIVFCQGATERGPWELYVVPAVGGTPTRLTEGGSDLHPYWYRAEVR
jgi:Tol biopolymer transport system component